MKSECLALPECDAPASARNGNAYRYGQGGLDWDHLLQVRRRPGLVAGRLVRPPTWKWCERHGRGNFEARLIGVDSEGAELDVALAASSESCCRSAHELEMVELRGSVVVAVGQIESSEWSPSSVRMQVEQWWSVDTPPLLQRLDILIEEEAAVRLLRAAECRMATRKAEEGVVDNLFGQVSAVRWMRRHLAENGLREVHGIDNYVWGIYPDTDFSKLARDAEVAQEMYRRSVQSRAASQRTLELAFDGDLIGSMQAFCGFGGDEFDDRDEMLDQMLTGSWGPRDRLKSSTLKAPTKLV